MIGHDALAAVFGYADTDVRMLGVEVVKPRSVVRHLAGVPSEVVVVADDVRDVVHRAVHRCHGDMSDGGQTGRIQLLAQCVQLLVILHQLLGDAADQDLVRNAPEADARMVVVLNNQLLHLTDAVLMRRRVLIHDADERDLRPDDKAHLITGVVEVLRMLIVRQTDGVRSQLLDDFRVLIVILARQGIALVQLVLMTTDTAQRRRHAVEDEALVRVAGEAADTGADRNLVIGLVAADERCGDRVQIRTVDLPQLSIRYGNRNSGIVRRTGCAGDLSAVGILDGILHRKVLIRIGHPARQLEHRAAALARLGRDLESRSAVVIQIKVRIRHADQIDAAVQTAVEREVRRLRIHAALFLVAARDDQQILLAVLAQIGDVRAEDGVAALVIDHLCAVDIDRRLLSCREHLDIGASASERLLRCREGLGVPALSAVVASVAVVTVHRVPRVRKLYRLPLGRERVRQSDVLLDKFPVLVQTDNRSHW